MTGALDQRNSEPIPGLLYAEPSNGEDWCCYGCRVLTSWALNATWNWSSFPCCPSLIFSQTPFQTFCPLLQSPTLPPPLSHKLNWGSCFLLLRENRSHQRKAFSIFSHLSTSITTATPISLPLSDERDILLRTALPSVLWTHLLPP